MHLKVHWVSVLFLTGLLIGCTEADEAEEPGRIVYQGNTYTEAELERLGIEIEHYAIDDELTEQGLVAGFDSIEESARYVTERHAQHRKAVGSGAGRLGADASLTSGCVNGYYYFYDGVYYGTPYFYLRPGQQVPNLNDTGWNDRIGSLTTANCPSTTILYEHYFDGKTLSFGPNSGIDSLSKVKISTFHSWNDKTSSIKVIGQHYYIASNTASATQNTINLDVPLLGGQTITMGTCGVDTAYGTGDTYLRLYDASGEQVAYNDDLSGCGLLSKFSYTAPASGTYQIRAGCYSSGSCSGMVAYLYQ